MEQRISIDTFIHIIILLLYIMAAAAAEPSGSTIESLFGPSTRFRDVHQNLRGGLPEGWTEVELLQDLTLEDVLATGNRLAPDDADLAILLRALANNRGLVDLDLRHHSTSDENWTIFSSRSRRILL
jgi:hypothetical protein